MCDRCYNVGIMSEKDVLNVTIDERLATLRFICNNKSHITVDNLLCKGCDGKNCLYFCPANVYTQENGIINVDYENCLECGTCRLCCPKGAICWEYPKDASGVSYRFG